MKTLFGNELCNTGRQIEFDIAKAVCILGMVFVHCFESLIAPATEEGMAYYVMTVVLDALFGAATFMLAMGLGISYSWKNDDSYPLTTIKRGIKIFICGYILGFIRDGLPSWIFYRNMPNFSFGVDVIIESAMVDIMQFAGLALILFGLLKKCKLSDKCIFLIAFGMSIFGSFVRLIPIENNYLCEFLGLFIGTVSELGEDYGGVFSISIWFIFVVGGYLYGNALKHCKNIHKYYSITFLVSGAILAVYLLIAIPNRIGMLNGDLNYYYQMTTIEAVICFIGMIFATSLYHFVSLVLNDKTKKVISKISSNINRTYCIHWVIIGFIERISKSHNGIFNLSAPLVFIVGCIIYIVSNLLAESYTQYLNKRKLAKQN